MFPALGGKQRRDRVTDVRDLLRTTCFLALLIGAAGCGGPDWKRLSVYERLQHSDPAARLWAVVEVGRSKDAKAVGYLVDRLTDSEPEIRMFAITSLEKITGQTLGYRCYDPPPAREAAVARWRGWLKRPPAGGGGKKGRDQKS